MGSETLALIDRISKHHAWAIARGCEEADGNEYLLALDVGQEEICITGDVLEDVLQAGIGLLERAPI